MATFLLMLALLFVMLAAHPYVTYPWSLLVLQAVKPRASLRHMRLDESRGELICAICVCAYNEERVIRRKLLNLLELRAREPGLQILIYIDAATDLTAEIVREYEAQIDLLIVATERHGKTHGMNLLAARANASILVFTDANVTMDLECTSDLKRYFADPEVGCVCGNLVYTNEGASVTAATGSAYWRYEEAIRRLESASGSMIGADGSIFAVRKALHRSPPDDIIDDMYVSLMVLCMGYRVVQADEDARAYEESTTAAVDEFNRKVRIACQAFNAHRLLWPQLRQLDPVTQYKYFSHKLMRWFTIYFLGAAMLSFEAALIVAGYHWLAAALAACLVLAFVLGRIYPHSAMAKIVDIFTAFVGAGLGIWQSIRGSRYQVWTPTASVRR